MNGGFLSAGTVISGDGVITGVGTMVSTVGVIVSMEMIVSVEMIVSAGAANVSIGAVIVSTGAIASARTIRLSVWALAAGEMSSKSNVTGKVRIPVTYSLNMFLTKRSTRYKYTKIRAKIQYFFGTDKKKYIF